VHVERQVELEREIDEPPEDLALDLEIGLLPDLPMVETDLADRHELVTALTDELLEIGGLLAVEMGRVQPRGRADLGVPGGEIEVAARVRERLADGHDRHHARRPGA